MLDRGHVMVMWAESLPRAGGLQYSESSGSSESDTSGMGWIGRFSTMKV